MIEQALINQLSAVITALTMLISSLSGVMVPSANFGATIPKTVALFETSLASKITSSATSMTLVSGTDKSGDALSGYICFTIDEGTASEEFVCGTASSTAISSMIRGIDPIDGDLEVASLAKEHRRGASVKITNYPQLAVISRILNGDETIPNILHYATSSTSSIVNAYDIPNKAYVDDVDSSGAANAAQDVKGIIEIATGDEVRAGMATGSTGALLVLPNSMSATNSSATTSIVITKNDGKIDQDFIDLSENFTITGTTTLATTSINKDFTVSGTTTLATTTVSSSTITSLNVGNMGLSTTTYIGGWYVFASGNNLYFSTTTSGNPFMVLTSSGDIGMGTTTPVTSASTTLDINGLIYANGGVSDKVVCWTSTRKLGYCSNQPDAQGACSCN